VGDITKKVGLCGATNCMTYADPAHLHAVSSVVTQTGVLYHGLHQAYLFYDANGNMLCATGNAAGCGAQNTGDAQNANYTSFNMVSSISQSDANGTPDSTCSLPDASATRRGFANQEEMPSAVCLVIWLVGRTAKGSLGANRTNSNWDTTVCLVYPLHRSRFQSHCYAGVRRGKLRGDGCPPHARILPLRQRIVGWRPIAYDPAGW